MPKGIYKRKSMSEETRKKLSEANKGQIPWNKGKIGIYSEEQLERIRKAGIGRKPRLGKISSPELRAKISKGLMGHVVSDDTKKKIGLSNSGEKSNLYKDGRCQNPEYKKHLDRQSRHNRKARLQEAVGFHTLGEWELLKKQYGLTCPCCGKSEPDIKLTEDHIVPLSKGGSNFIENIQPLCRICNSKKHTRIIAYLPTENTDES